MRNIKAIVITCLLSIIIFGNILFSQSQFDLILPFEGRNIISVVEQNENGFFYGIINQKSQTSENGLLIRVSPQGDTLIKIFYSNQDTLYSMGKIVFDSLNSSFYCIGRVKLLNSKAVNEEIESIQNWIVKFDESLNVMWQKFYPYPQIYQLTGGGVSNSIIWNNRIYCFGNIIRNYAFNDMYLLKLDLEGNLLHSRYTFCEDSLDNKYYSCHGLCEKNDSLLVGLISGNSNYSNSYDVIQIDTNLNYTAVIIENEPSIIVPGTGSKFFIPYKNGYLICTRSVQNSDESVLIAKMNSDYHYTDWKVNDTEYWDDKPARYKSIDYFDSNRIYIGGTHDTSPVSNGDHWVYLAVYDSSLNLIAMKFYGEEYGNHSLMSINATSDGGCFMAGGFRDYLNAPPQQNDIWIKKVTYDDIVGLSEETSAQNDYDAMLFPNPVEDYFKIITARKDLELRLYDINGKLVKQKKITDFPVQKFSAYELSTGTYVYRLYDLKRNYEVQNGKLIKL